MYLFLLGQKEVRKNLGILEEKLEAALFAELDEYRNILHPLKLSIMQLVYVDNKISSVEVKDKLEISWSDHHRSINSLSKLNFINVIEDFDQEGSKRQFLVITEHGKLEYVRLIKIISKFIDRASELIPNFDSDLLYPRS